MPRHRLVGLVSVFLFAIAIGPASAARLAPRGAGADTGALEQVGEPTLPEVRLLDAGTEPRRLLRYHLTPGRTESLQLVMTMSVTTEIGSEEIVVDVPASRVVESATVVSVDAEGVADVEIAITAADLVDPAATGETADAMRGSLAELVGTSASMRVGDRGQILESHIELPATVDATVQQTMQSLGESLGQIVSPLPEEPVGIGARWEVTSEVTKGLIVMDATTAFSLVEMTGDVIGVEVSTRQSADPQPIALDTLPEGAEAMLASMESTGSGTTAYDLGSLVPTATTVGSSSARYSISMADESMEFGMVMTMDAAMGPAT